MFSKKIRIGLVAFAAVAVLAAPTSAFAGDGDEGTPLPWTYNQPAQWEYNPGTPNYPSQGITLGQPQQVDTTLELAKPKLKFGSIEPCMVLKTC